ncbi:CAP domain-containing protein [Lacticaseibacillus salsurivasis]|uniref:CAP domain-containing protein n=1 Tax=Lacticaseibacillus salsurivasis TaxID=3081441 RepID=UPI0030C66C07
MMSRMQLKQARQAERIVHKKMYKAKKIWVAAGMTLFAVGMFAVSNVGVSGQTVSAATWTANSVAAIKARISAGQTSLTMINGDTVYNIGQAINMKNPMDLLAYNNIKLGEQYQLQIGTVIKWDGNHVTVQDAAGNTVADKVVTDAQKVDPNKPIGNQTSDQQANPVKTDAHGNVVKAGAKANTTAPATKPGTVTQPAKPDQAVVNQIKDAGQDATEDQTNAGQTTPETKPGETTPSTDPDADGETEPTTQPQTPVLADKPSLQQFIEATKTLKAADFTPASFAAVTAAGDALQGLYDDPTATAAQAAQAIGHYLQAVQQLVPAAVVVPAMVDMTALNETIANAEALNPAYYTEDSFKTLAPALAEAKSTQASTGTALTQAAVDAAVNHLIDTLNALVLKPAETPVDKTALQSTIAEADATDLTGKTTTSAAALTDALGAAKAIAASESATQTEVDAATETLKTAIAGLTNQPVAKVDKTALQAAIDDAESRNGIHYTDESSADLLPVYEASYAVNQDPDATQAEVDAATKALNDILAGLVEEPVEIPVEKRYLAEAVANAENILNDGSTYTSDSTAALTAALATGNRVNNDDAATQAEVDAALEALNDALGNMLPATTEPATPVDKSAFQAAISQLEALDPAKYTAASYEAAQTVLTRAKGILADDTLTQTDIDAATADVNAALNAMVEKPVEVKADKTALESAITKAKAALVNQNYYEDVTALSAALDASKALDTQNNATQAEVDQATQTLTSALDALKVQSFVVHVVYVDEAGQTVGSGSDAFVDAGASYTVDAVAPDGYELVGAAQQSFTITQDETTLQISVKKAADVAKTVTIQALDMAGNVIKTFAPITLAADQTSYTASAPELAGYTAFGAMTHPLQTATAKDYVVNFRYIKNVVNTTSKDDAFLQKVQQSLADQINAYREENGLAALKTDRTDLQAFADQRAEDMFTSYSHVNPDGLSWVQNINAAHLGEGLGGENLNEIGATSYLLNPEITDEAAASIAKTILAGWIDDGQPDQPHRANLLDARFDDMAVAVALGTDENGTPAFFGVYEGIESGN